ncbi:MAG: hypothetical protein J7518_22885 [Nocardioidaceae bacterium]|nr:hypothetical protein [Nocardioidaceae bacterium]
MRRVRAVPVLLTTLALAATGCSFSSVDPHTTVHVSGRALDAAGRPLDGTKVLLFKEADLGEVVFGTALVLGSLSTICLLPDAPGICEKARHATTDAAGRYRFTLKGEDTQGSLGTEATLDVVVGGGPGGSSTTVGFHAKDTEVEVPDVRLADLAARHAGLTVTWKPLPRAAGREPSYAVQLYDGRTRSAVWSQPARGGRATLDPRVLEDSHGAVAVGATAELPGGRNTGTVHASYLSRRLPVTATAGAPPSRGKTCAPVAGTSVGRFAACPVTDGDLDRPGRLPSSKDGVTTGVVVDLGRVRRIDLVVARGYAGQLLVEVSSDGRTYRTVATGSGRTVALEPKGPASARYVRLRSATGLDESLGAELSIW